jgi:hypothetical protein
MESITSARRPSISRCFSRLLGITGITSWGITSVERGGLACHRPDIYSILRIMERLHRHLQNVCGNLFITSRAVAPEGARVIFRSFMKKVG